MYCKVTHWMIIIHRVPDPKESQWDIQEAQCKSMSCLIPCFWIASCFLHAESPIRNRPSQSLIIKMEDCSHFPKYVTYCRRGRMIALPLTFASCLLLASCCCLLLLQPRPQIIRPGYRINVSRFSQNSVDSIVEEATPPSSVGSDDGPLSPDTEKSIELDTSLVPMDQYPGVGLPPWGQRSWAQSYVWLSAPRTTTQMVLICLTMRFLRRTSTRTWIPLQLQSLFPPCPQRDLKHIPNLRKRMTPTQTILFRLSLNMPMTKTIG